MLAGLYRGPGRDIVAWNSALLYDMIYTQPVFYEFEEIKVPVLLMVGDKDTTALGKNLAPPSIARNLGQLSGAGQGGGEPLSPRADWSNFPIWGTHRRSRHPTYSTRRYLTACAALQPTDLPSLEPRCPWVLSSREPARVITRDLRDEPAGRLGRYMF